MKKLILAGGIVVLVAAIVIAIAACDGVDIPGSGSGDGIYQFDKEGNLTGLTLKLEAANKPSASVSRALSHYMANLNYNYFEVVFYDGTDVARAKWSKNGTAVIRGVPRGTAGVDYGVGYRAAYAAGEGAAALFVGRQESNALLAVGLLTHVDGVAGTTVAADSKTVTFTVRSLVAGLASSIPATADIYDVTFKFEDESPVYPALNLDADDANTINYAFGFSGLTAGANGPEIISRFAAIRVILEAAPSTIGPKIVFDHPSVVKKTKTVQVREALEVEKEYGGSITLANNAALATAAAGTVVFTIDTTGILDPVAPAETGGLISFYYEIPVYAVTRDGTNPAPAKWRVIPSGYLEDLSLLDKGEAQARGGSILLTVGSSDDFEIDITEEDDDALYILY
jgi:hypothetical protein